MLAPIYAAHESLAYLAVPIHVGIFIRQVDSGTRMPLINTPGVDAALSVHPMYRVAVASGA